MQGGGMILRILTCGLLALTVCTGCSREAIRKKAKQATNKAGQVVGEGASTFFTGVGEGIVRTVTHYDVRLSDELKSLGLSVTIAQSVPAAGEDGKKPALSFYVLNQTALTGTLRLRLFNADGKEIGRSQARVDFAADDARYVPFVLDPEIPLSMTKYVELDLKKNDAP